MLTEQLQANVISVTFAVAERSVARLEYARGEERCHNGRRHSSEAHHNVL